MCGIAGYVGARVLEPDAGRRCLARMRRRGPDAAGSFSHERDGRRALLLHSRLRIIDLDERANQPFRIGTKVLVYNGELYNYLELRAELEARGHAFRTASDTEVLLRLIVEDGLDALDRCEGMWAFALYDTESGSLTLCRDRFGEKPLWLFEDESGLWFGSEVKFLRELRGRSFQPDAAQLHRYLVNGYRSLHKTGASFFRGVRELPAGSWLELRADGSRRERAYWTPPGGAPEPMTREAAVAGAREHLRQAVRLRLRADVPMAFCLSGGVDSAALTALAVREWGYDAHAFTLVSDDPRYDESQAASATARELGVRHTPVAAAREDFLDNLRTIVAQHDAPLYTLTFYLNWLLVRAIAAAGYRVCVAGPGADELFAGYYDHHLFWLAEVHGTPHFAEGLAAWEKHVHPIVRNPGLQDPMTFVRDPDERGHLYLDAPAFSRFLRADFHEGFQERRYCESTLRNRMANELYSEVVPVILHGDDLNAMYFSVENRSPFLDRRLVEFCARIPTEHLFRDGYGKSVLREALAGTVSDRVLHARRKVGFNANLLSLVDLAEPDVREWLLDDSPIYEHVRRDRIEELASAEFLPNSRSKFLFYFLSAKTFLEEIAS